MYCVLAVTRGAHWPCKVSAMLFACCVCTGLVYGKLKRFNTLQYIQIVCMQPFDASKLLCSLCPAPCTTLLASHASDTHSTLRHAETFWNFSDPHTPQKSVCYFG